jgi:RNAse (barnase) inhibitor barstar
MIPKLVINVGHFSSSPSLQEGLAAVLGFPGWYGKNWDAFRDCVNHSDISDMPSVLVIRGCELLAERLPRDARLLRELLAEMTTHRPELSIQWEVVDEDKSQ